MASCFDITCFSCTLYLFIGLVSFLQFCLGAYLTFVETDITIINRLVKTDKWDSYLLYTPHVFIGLGLMTVVLSFFSIYSIVRRFKSLSFVVAIVWVSHF